MFTKLLKFEVFYQFKQRAFPMFAVLFLCLGVFVGRQGFAPTGVNYNSVYQVYFHTSLFTLGSVKYSRFKKFKNINSAKNFYKRISKKEILKRRKKSENVVINFYPEFKRKFKFISYYKSLTTLFNSKKDSRPTLINKNKRLITVLVGKIDTIFEAEKKILNILKKN